MYVSASISIVWIAVSFGLQTGMQPVKSVRDLLLGFIMAAASFEFSYYPMSCYSLGSALSLSTILRLPQVPGYVSHSWKRQPSLANQIWQFKSSTFWRPNFLQLQHHLSPKKTSSDIQVGTLRSLATLQLLTRGLRLACLL